MTVPVIVRKNVRINVRLILNVYRAGALWIHKYKGIVNGNKESEITLC